MNARVKVGNKLSAALLSVLVILLLLIPVINIAGPLAFKSLDVYAAVLLSFYAVVRMAKSGVKYAALIKILAISFIILISHMLLLEVLFHHGDEVLLLFPRLAITILAAYGCALALVRVKNDDALPFFFKLVILAAVLQGCVLALTFLNDSFRDFMSVLFYRDIREGAEHLILLRVPGFFVSGGDGLSMNQALLGIVGLSGVLLHFNTSRYRSILVVILLFSVLATAFTGRSGLYLGVVFFTLILATHSNNLRVSIGVVKASGALLVLLIPIVLFSNQIGMYGQSLYEEYGYEYPLVRLLRGFIDMQATGTYSDQTIQLLVTDMVVIPDDPVRFLFGNGNFGQAGLTRVPTDVGYFRMWHGIGLYGLVVFLWGVFCYPFITIRNVSLKARKNVSTPAHYRQIVSYTNLLLIVLLFGLIAHYKIFYLSTRVYGFVFFVLMFLIYHQLQSFRNRRK